MIKNCKFGGCMKKVLRIINRLNVGGPTHNVAYLTKYLEPEFETMLVSGNIDSSSELSSDYIIENLGIKPVIIPEMEREISWSKDRAAYKKIKQIIQDFKPDIVHTHAAKAGALGRLAASNSGVKAIFHTFHGHVFHSYFGKVKTRIFIEIEKWLAKKSTKIITVSDLLKKELAEQFNIAPKDKIEVVYNGFDLSKFAKNIDEKRKYFREQFDIQDDDIAVGLIGRIVPVKNHPMFIEGFALALKKNPKLKAVIVGGGAESDIEALKKQTESLGIPSDKIVYTGWQKEMDVVVAGMEMLVQTSLNEGTPVAMVEAQAGSKPVISTEVGGVADTILDKKSGFLIPSQDAQALADKIIELAENEELRKKMGDIGLQFVSDRFTYQSLCKNMANLYNRHIS